MPGEAVVERKRVIPGRELPAEKINKPLQLRHEALGEAAGAAAALAVQDGVAPRHLDVRRLQRHLLQQGFWLGEPARLVQLGLADS